MAKLYFLLFLLLSVPLCAQMSNFDFEQQANNGKPANWNQIGNVNDYSFILDSVARHNGRYALRVAYVSGTGFSGLNGNCPLRSVAK